MRQPPPDHYVTCQRCGLQKAVRSAAQARRQRYCTRRCAGLATGWFATLTPADAKRVSAVGARAARAKRLARLEARLAQTTLTEFYRRAYRAGYNAGIRYMQKWAS